MKISEVTDKDHELWAEFRHKLWPKYPKTYLLEDIAVSKRQYPKYSALVAIEGGIPVGYIELSFHQEYVSGSTTSPVAYVEGIFVEKSNRRKGIAKKLFKAAEGWARKNGATEIGSDVELENKDSQKLHKSLGFKEAERIVEYIKKL